MTVNEYRSAKHFTVLNINSLNGSKFISVLRCFLISTAERKLTWTELFPSNAVLMKWSVECGNDPVRFGCGWRVQALVSGKFFSVETVCYETLTLHVHPCSWI